MDNSARPADLGSVPMPPPEFGKFIAEEISKWGNSNVIRAANIKPEYANRRRTVFHILRRTKIRLVNETTRDE
jgi:hypothetical protein